MLLLLTPAVADKWVWAISDRDCPHRKRKPTCAISSKRDTHMVHGRTSECSDPELKKVKTQGHAVMKMLFRSGYACRYDCARFLLSS